MFNRRYSFANPTVRSATALLVLVGICASALPIPLGRIVRQANDSSQPFPCQHCACGCKSAEQCWTSCCCYTPAQKAKWAKENGVTPPAYAALEDERSLADDRTPGAEPCTKSCCSKKGTDKQPPKSKQLVTCSNCSSTSKACEKCSQPDASDAEDDPESEAVIVLSIMAYKCSGQATVFSLLPWAIIEPQPNVARCWELLGRHEPDQAVIPIRVYLFPDVPPPRAVG
jgi:hypothetical protein